MDLKTLVMFHVPHKRQLDGHKIDILGSSEECRFWLLTQNRGAANIEHETRQRKQ
jgi:hypothetical protein